MLCVGRDLNKTLIRYLEDRLVQTARKSERYLVLTKNTHSNTVVKESDIAAMEEFIGNVKVLISLLGYKVLEPIIQKDSASSQDDRILYLCNGSTEAKAIITTEGFVLISGSPVNEKTTDSLSAGIIKSRNEHLDSGKVKDWKTTEDILFSSPSSAAGFVLGSSASGPAM